MSNGALNAIIGESQAIANVRDLICTVAPTKLPILIEGPTGAGKELVAAAIHEQSGRRGSFVPFNVCAIGESMFEDALFGHVRGAFTGASSDTLGFLREANGGTAFFDEVSGLHPLMQVKLLRAIETGEFRPVGARRDFQSDFRVVAATNERVATLVANGRVRADLAHRFSGVVIVVPALRDRIEDLPVLVRHFLARAAQPTVIDIDALDTLRAHSWPGNVRELRHVVECAVVLGGLRAVTVRALLSQHENGVVTTQGGRRRKLRATLEANRWNATLTAEALGVDRATVYRWIKKDRLV